MVLDVEDRWRQAPLQEVAGLARLTCRFHLLAERTCPLTRPQRIQIAFGEVAGVCHETERRLAPGVDRELAKMRRTRRRRNARLRRPQRGAHDHAEILAQELVDALPKRRPVEHETLADEA